MTEIRTYTKFVPDSLVRLLGCDAALLAARLAAFAGEDGTACVSAEYLCEVFGWSEGSLRNYAKKLAVFNIWTRSTTAGRGKVSVWKKGANFNTFMTIEKVQILQKKGANFAGKNKEKNNNICARATEPVSDGSVRGAKPRKGDAALPLYYNGDSRLTPAMIDGMVKIRHNKRLAYCNPEDLNTCLLGGADIFKPIEDEKSNN